MYITLAHRTTTTTTITTMTVIAVVWGSSIVIPLSLEILRMTKMLFILSLAIITIITGHTTRLLFLATMTMFVSDVHPTTTTTTTMGRRKWLFLATMTTFVLAVLPARITTIITTVDTRK